MAAFWNNGNQTMHGDQIVKADPLRIRVAEGCEILQAYVVATTRDIIDAQVSIAGWSSAIDVSFDFLERGDGFVIFLAHTGGAGDASVQGTIKGVRQGPRNIKTGWNGVTGVLAVFFLTLVFVLLSRYFVSQISDSEIASYTAGGMTITLAIVILAAAQFVSRLRFRSFPRAFRRDPRLAMLLPHLAEVNSGNNVLN
jgi:hypothetical protein